MGLLTVNDAVEVLRSAGIRAGRGWPGGGMPQPSGLCVAVNVEQVEETSVTLVATVCCSGEMGGPVCEDGAGQVIAAWRAAGGRCSQKSCDYDGNCDLFTVCVLGTWTAAPDWSGGKLRYKTFTWPENPSLYRVESVREPVYRTDGEGEASFAGLGVRQRVVTGEGCFLGRSAYTDFKVLETLVADGTAGALVHPVWGTMTAFLTELTLEQEVEADRVVYRFTFREADSGGAIPQ